MNQTSYLNIWILLRKRVFEQILFVQQRLLLKKENGAKENKLAVQTAKKGIAHLKNGLICMEFIPNFKRSEICLMLG